MEPKRHPLASVLAFTTLAVVVAAVAFALARRVPQVGSVPASGAQLVFDEEFDGSALDVSRWAVETPWHTQYVDGELEWYAPQNVRFPGGGIMRIVTERRRTGLPNGGQGYEYTSGMITTGSRPDTGGTSRAAFKYGYFEMRAKLPAGRGVFPAFWLTNDRSSEIDVVELLGQRPDTVHMTLRSFEGEKRVQTQAYVADDFSVGYHTFAIDWQPDYVRFYVDGIERASYAEDVPSEPLWIVVNTAVGGAWAGPPDRSTVFPQHFDVDYIRVWRSAPR